MDMIYVVYTITLQGKVMYVGKTCNFTTRKRQHLNKIGTIYSAIPVEIDQKDLSFDIVYLTDNKENALKEEDRLIMLYNTIEDGWNKNRSGLLPIDNRRRYCKHKEYYKSYYEIHKEDKRKYQREYFQTHKSEIKERNKEYVKEYYKKYYKEHKEEIIARVKVNKLKRKAGN